MPYTQHQAIVLHSFLPSRQKVSLFDASAGRLDTTFRSAASCALMQGALITYESHLWKGRTMIEGLTLCKLPQPWVCQDLLFLHHVLEMIHYFSPEHSHAKRLFEFLLFLYEEQPEAQSDLLLVKRLFIAKLFALLGIYPEGVERSELRSLFYMLTTGDKTQADRLTDEQLHTTLKTWLWECVQTHPQVEQFKTVSFLNTVE